MNKEQKEVNNIADDMNKKMNHVYAEEILEVVQEHIDNIVNQLESLEVFIEDIDKDRFDSEQEDRLNTEFERLDNGNFCF